MYTTRKSIIFFKSLLLMASLLSASVVNAESFEFNVECGTNCHGPENIGSTVDGFVTPPVRDGSRAGIENSLNAVPAHNPVPKVIFELYPPAERERILTAIVAQLAALNPPPPTCTPPQTLVNGACTDPNTPPPTCTAPQTLVNGVCTTPAPPAPILCDDSHNTAACANLPSQLGSLGSADSSDAKSDVYKIRCSKPGATVSATVSGLTADNPAKLSIQISRGKDRSPVRTDTAGGDGVPSNAARLSKGPGAYKVKITKSKSSVPGVVQYDAAISCLNKKKAVIGSNVLINSNQ